MQKEEGEDGDAMEQSGDAMINMAGNIDLAAVSSLPGPEVLSLFFFSVEHWVRATCIQIYTHIKFAQVILVIILLNSILMLITYSVPCEEKHPCLQEVAYWIDLIFTICFTFEMVIKVIALGFVFHDQAYLRNGWNVLDFTTVVASIVSLTGAGSNVSILRLLRILRPLRTMSKVAGLRNLMGALFAAVPEIRDNVILIIFLVIIFAILGVQLFGGAYHNRCIILPTANITEPLPTLLNTTSLFCGGSYTCPSESITPLLPSDIECDHNWNPPRDPLSFDHLGVAMLLVFKVFSGDDWPVDMINIMNATSPHYWFYFFMCIMVGGLFATNLFLAVLINAYYTNAKKAEDNNEDSEKRAKAAWCRLLPHPEREARAGSVVSGLQVMVKSIPASAFAERRPSQQIGHESQSSDDSGGSTGGESEKKKKGIYIHHLPKPTTAFKDNAESPKRKSVVIIKETESETRAEEDPLPENHFDRARVIVTSFVMHPKTEIFVLIMTAVNVVALATDHHDIDATLFKVLEVIGIVCLCIFALEILLKIFGLGPVRCLRDPYNAFDAFLVVISLPDLATGGSSAFSAFRAFRMMRALRFVRRWPSVHNLLKALIGCLNEGMYVALLLLLQIFIFSILGMQLFEGNFPSDFRGNFNSLWEASLTCFVVITGDAWAEVMKEGIIATNGAAAVYFLLLFLVGNYVLVNVVVAVILDKLDDNILGSDDEEEDITFVENQEVLQAGEQLEMTAVTGAEDILSPLSDQSMDPRRDEPKKKSMFVDDEEEGNPLLAYICAINDLEISEKSLGCLGRTNPMRAFLAKVVFSRIFDVFIVVAIMVNVVFLALESPNNGDELNNILQVTNYVFTTIFFIEMVVKILVTGVWLPAGPYTPNQAVPYLRDSWNRVDCVVVMLAVVGVFYKPLSAFRSLRTLRLVIRSAQLRLVIAAMLSTLPSITQGLVVCGFIWFVFGILGTQLFKGTFYYCNDASVEYEGNCTEKYYEYVPAVIGEDVIEVDRAWKREPDHFDNVFSSMYTLFAVAVGEGWASIMYRGIDATEVGRGPVTNYNPPAAVFFVVFHVVGNFFCVNLIVGILINNFTENRKSMSANDGLTERQRKYVETVVITGQRLLQMKTPPPQQEGRKQLYFVATHPFFEHVITTVIIINMVFLSTIHHGQTKSWENAQDIGNYFCTAVFALEAVIKIVAYYPRAYFKDNWNRFDFIIVVLSVIGLLLPDASGISAVRVLRVGRLFRLVHAAQGLQKLFNTMFEGQNLAYFANVGVLCVACFFMFGVAGVSMFGRLQRTNGLDHNLNFETVPNAMLTLFAISTTEGWLDVRNGLTNKDDCGGVDQGSCGSKYATVYMLAFMIVGSFMMLNLFAAVVVELFEAQEAQEKRAQEVAALLQLQQRWEKIFGSRKHVPCPAFVTAVFQGGLFPARLKRMPRLPRIEDNTHDSSVACITLTNKPSVGQMLAFLIALGLPIVLINDKAMVAYADMIQCCIAKVFCLQSTDLRALNDVMLLKGYPRSGRKVGHWFTGMVWAKRSWRDNETMVRVKELEEEEESHRHQH